MTPASLEPKVTRKASYEPMRVRRSRPSENYSESLSRESVQFLVNRQGGRVHA